MNTFPFASQALALGGLLSLAVALAHLVCIAIGAPAYRAMGAGEKMAQAATEGKRGPALVTACVALVLGIWGAYALGGAGALPALPLTRAALVAITVVFLARGLAFPLLKPAFPGNSNMFWLVSSGICLTMGVLYLYGTIGRWGVL